MKRGVYARSYLGNAKRFSPGGREGSIASCRSREVVSQEVAYEMLPDKRETGAQSAAQSEIGPEGFLAWVSREQDLESEVRFQQAERKGMVV